MTRSGTDGKEGEDERPDEQKVKERLAREEAEHITDHKQREDRMERLNAGLLSLGHEYHRSAHQRPSSM